MVVRAKFKPVSSAASTPVSQPPRPSSSAAKQRPLERSPFDPPAPLQVLRTSDMMRLEKNRAYPLPLWRPQVEQPMVSSGSDGVPHGTSLKCALGDAFSGARRFG